MTDQTDARSGAPEPRTPVRGRRAAARAPEPERSRRSPQHHGRSGASSRSCCSSRFGLAFLVKTFLVQAFYIPSGSMEHTLAVGDRVLVNKLVYKTRDIERGDVVVFNGVDSFTPEVTIVEPSGPIAAGRRLVRPHVRLRPAGRARLRQARHRRRRRPRDVLRRAGPGRPSTACRSTRRRTSSRATRRATTPFDVVVPEGKLWVMGDHRARQQRLARAPRRPRRRLRPHRPRHRPRLRGRLAVRRTRSGWRSPTRSRTIPAPTSGLTVADLDPQARGSERRAKRAQGRCRSVASCCIIVGVALVLSVLVRTFVAQAFFVPSSSMEDTLLIQDRILASKLTHPDRRRQPRRDRRVHRPGRLARRSRSAPTGLAGTVRKALMFVGLLPSDTGEDLVKRVIGVGGDHVACCDAKERITSTASASTRRLPQAGRRHRPGALRRRRARRAASSSWATTAPTRPTRATTSRRRNGTVPRRQRRGPGRGRRSGRCRAGAASPCRRSSRTPQIDARPARPARPAADPADRRHSDGG